MNFRVVRSLTFSLLRTDDELEERGVGFGLMLNGDCGDVLADSVHSVLDTEVKLISSPQDVCETTIKLIASVAGIWCWTHLPHRQM